MGINEVTSAVKTSLRERERESIRSSNEEETNYGLREKVMAATLSYFL